MKSVGHRHDDGLPDADDAGEGLYPPNSFGSGAGSLGGHDAAALFANDPADGLGSKVLVLNRAYAAMRIVSAKRAFCLLSRSIAEIIHVEPDGSGGGRYVNYDLDSWI
jgi:hypothetical protein